MIELQDKLMITTPSSGFDQIDEPLPIKPSSSDSDLIFDLQALPSQPLVILNSITSSLSRTPMDSTSPNLNGMLLILPRTNRRSAKRKGRKEKKNEEEEL